MRLLPPGRSTTWCSRQTEAERRRAGTRATDAVQTPALPLGSSVTWANLQPLCATASLSVNKYRQSPIWDGATSRFFDFTMAGKQYAFGRNRTLSTHTITLFSTFSTTFNQLHEIFNTFLYTRFVLDGFAQP